MDLKNIDLKNINFEDIKAKVIQLADKKTLIKVGISTGAIILFLIIYYSILNPMVDKRKAKLNDMNKKKEETAQYIKDINKTKKTNLLKKLIIEVKINTNDVLNIHFNKNHKLTLNNIDNTDMFLKYLKSNHPLDLATFLNDNRFRNLKIIDSRVKNQIIIND